MFFMLFYHFLHDVLLFQRACATEDTILKYILYLGLPYLYMVFGAVINGRMEKLMCNATCRRKCRWSLAQKDLEILKKISGFSIDGGIGMPFSGCFTWGGYLLVRVGFETPIVSFSRTFAGMIVSHPALTQA